MGLKLNLSFIDHSHNFCAAYTRTHLMQGVCPYLDISHSAKYLGDHKNNFLKFFLLSKISPLPTPTFRKEPNNLHRHIAIRIQKYLLFLITRKIATKTKIKYDFTLHKITIKKKERNNKCCQEHKKFGTHDNSPKNI